MHFASANGMELSLSLAEQAPVMTSESLPGWTRTGADERRAPSAAGRPPPALVVAQSESAGGRRQHAVSGRSATARVFFQRGGGVLEIEDNVLSYHRETQH